MSKQELFERISHLPSDCSGPLPMINKLAVLEFIKLLDEPQKVQVPQFVADWIEYCKNTGLTLKQALMLGEVYFYSYANQEDFTKLKEFLKVENNQELFARAWLDGYEVEKEKRYRVKMKGMNKSSTILKLDEITGSWYLGEDAEYSYTKIAHTRKELEEAGFGEVFDSLLFEVEEVEE